MLAELSTVQRLSICVPNIKPSRAAPAAFGPNLRGRRGAWNRQAARHRPRAFPPAPWEPAGRGGAAGGAAPLEPRRRQIGSSAAARAPTGPPTWWRERWSAPGGPRARCADAAAVRSVSRGPWATCSSVGMGGAGGLGPERWGRPLGRRGVRRRPVALGGTAGRARRAEGLASAPPPPREAGGVTPQRDPALGRIITGRKPRNGARSPRPAGGRS